MVIFLASPFSSIFFPKIFAFLGGKNEKVKTAQNTAPVHRIWLLPVWKKTRAGPKNTFKISLIFATFLAQIGGEKAEKSSAGTKIASDAVFGNAFLGTGAILVDFLVPAGTLDGPKVVPKSRSKIGKCDCGFACFFFPPFGVPKLPRDGAGPLL